MEITIIVLLGISVVLGVACFGKLCEIAEHTKRIGEDDEY